MSRRGGLGISDCDTCMKSTPALNRQYLGCGYLPPLDGKVHLTVWQPPAGERGYKGPALTTCAGYTANLPDVVEVAKIRLHWKHGNVVAACGGEQPRDEVLDCILVLDGEYNAIEGWLMTPARDGGGGS